ncbi:MAG: TolC family protein, partial [Deltaproteobacteria bacterium]|nr:TolC family protein [Deltaproteobacteria bacterium]
MGVQGSGFRVQGSELQGLGATVQGSGWYKVIKIFLVSFLLAPGPWPLTPVFAQETLSLKTLVEEAKEKNPEIQAFRQRVKAKEFKAKVEGVLDDPTFKVEIEDIPKKEPFNLGSSMLTRYTFSQMLPFPGKLSLREKMALKEALMAGAELREKELEIITVLKEVYYEYAFIVESIKIAREIKTVLEDMARITEVRYSLGQTSQQDVIKAQVEISMLINELLMLEQEKGVAQARLNAILNRDPTSPIGEPEKVPRERVDIKINELIERAIDKNPRLRAMVYEIDVQGVVVELANKNYYPDFMIGVAPIQRDGRFDSWDAMFSINIPIWRSKYDNQVKEARATREVLLSRLKAEKNIKTFEVKDAVIKVDTADRIRTLYETGLLPQAELSLSSALVNYQTGKVDFLTLLDNVRVLKKTKIEYIRTLVDYDKGVALLERVVGEEMMPWVRGQAPAPMLRGNQGQGSVASGGKDGE